MSEKISRRKFLGQAGCAALSTSTLFSSLMSLSSLNALAAKSTKEDPDYKALVCVLLSGGCDSFNILVPRNDSSYNEYANTRGNVALQKSQLLPINALNGNGKEFGLHPKLTKVQQMFEQGNAAFVSGVGTLVHPISNVDDYKNNKYKVPVGLYSHSDQTKQWQTSVPQSRVINTGWAGRTADILHSLNEGSNISMNISLAGRNVFQSGNSVIEYAIKNTGVKGLTQLGGGKSGMLNRIRENAIDNILAQGYSNVLESTYAEMHQNTIESYAQFSNAIDRIEPFATNFSNNSLSNDLKMVSNVIAARNALNLNRQTFFVNYGGWDHHKDLLIGQNTKFDVVNNAITEFYSALAEMGLEDRVTLFTISDFSRTMTSNTTGTDHAWGANAMVLGGGVNGKRIYGTYPDLYLENNPLLTSGRGVVIPQVSTDEYFADMALWFGLSPGDLHYVLPNIGNFYTYSPAKMPLGMMKY